MSILRVKDRDGNVKDIPAIVGPPGKSAYEYAKDGGFDGTEEEFMELLASGGTVKTVNGIEPDENGNVEVECRSEGADLTGYAKESFVKEYAQPKGEYLETSDLPNAINTALEAAKESGEFNGANGQDGYTPQKGTDYFTEADKQELVEDVLEQVDITTTNDIEISETEPTDENVDIWINPSNDEEVHIYTAEEVDEMFEQFEVPSGGNGGSGKAKTQKLMDVTIEELVSDLSVTLEHDFHRLFVVWKGFGNYRLVNEDGSVVDNYATLMIDTNSITWNGRKLGRIKSLSAQWKEDALLVQYTEDMTTFLGSYLIEITVGNNKYIQSNFGGGEAMIGTVSEDKNQTALLKGKTLHFVAESGFFNIGTRVVIVGEYFE